MGGTLKGSVGSVGGTLKGGGRIVQSSAPKAKIPVADMQANWDALE